MKKLILAFIFFSTISFALASPFTSNFETNKSSVIEDKDIKFTITGDYESVMKDVESIMKMERSVKSCTIEITVLSTDNESISVSLKSKTCYTTAKLMKDFLETVDGLGYKI